MPLATGNAILSTAEICGAINSFDESPRTFHRRDVILSLHREQGDGDFNQPSVEWHQAGHRVIERDDSLEMRLVHILEMRWTRDVRNLDLLITELQDYE